MIAFTTTQNFEEGENYASTLSVEHTLGSDMKLFGYDMILFGSGFKFQELPVMHVATLINFGVKSQVQQVSFKIVAEDLISFHTLGYDMNLFGYDMILFGYDMILFGSDMILFGSSFKFQELLINLVDDLINFGVTNQVPQVSFKLVVGDLMLVSSMTLMML